MTKRISDLAAVEGATCDGCMAEAAMDYLGDGHDDISVKVPRQDERRVRELLARQCPREDKTNERETI